MCAYSARMSTAITTSAFHHSGMSSVSYTFLLLKANLMASFFTFVNKSI